LSKLKSTSNLSIKRNILKHSYYKICNDQSLKQQIDETILSNKIKSIFKETYILKTKYVQAYKERLIKFTIFSKHIL